MQKWLNIDGIAPQCRQVKVNAEILPCNFERRVGKRRRMDAGALVVQALPVNLPVILACPQSDVTKLPQADTAAHKVFVGVQNQSISSCSRCWSFRL